MSATAAAKIYTCMAAARGHLENAEGWISESEDTPVARAVADLRSAVRSLTDAVEELTDEHFETPSREDRLDAAEVAQHPGRCSVCNQRGHAAGACESVR